MEWVQTIIAVCAALGAISAAIVTWWVYRDSKNPEAITYLERSTKSGAIYLVIKNIGKGAAYDVRIDSSKLPSQPSDIEAYLRSFAGVSVLAPQSSRSILAFVPEMVKEAPKGTFDVSVSYSKSPGGKTFDCVFPLEYESFSSELRTDTNETLQRRAIEDLAKSVRALPRKWWA